MTREQRQPCLDDEGELDSDTASVSLEAEVPEVLFLGMREFIRNHPHWDQYSVISSALAGFLFQNGCGDPSVTQHYLDGLFLNPSNHRQSRERGEQKKSGGAHLRLRFLPCPTHG